MANFPNPYNIPDLEYYFRRYINDLPDPLTALTLEVGDDSNNWLDSFQHSIPFTSCRSLQEDIEYSDDWNRVDNFDLGSNWEQFEQLGTVSFKVESNQLVAFREVGAINRIRGAWFKNFPVTSHQIAKLTFNGSSFLSVPSAPSDIINGGGPCVRMTQTNPSGGWDQQVKCYLLKYQEERSSTPPYDVINNNFDIWMLDGNGGETQLAFTILSSPLSIGDEVSISAMNYFGFGVDLICLKGFVNGVQKLSVTNILASGGTGILTGRAGIGVGGGDGDASFQMNWDNWKAYTAIPI